MKKNGASPRQITLCAFARFEADKMHVTVAPVGDAFIARGSAVELWVWHRSRREQFVRTRIDDFGQPSGRTVVLDLAQVPAGTAELQAVLVDRWGRECVTHLIQSADPPGQARVVGLARRARSRSTRCLDLACRCAAGRGSVCG